MIIFLRKNQNEFTNSANNVTLENDDGYALKLSYKFPYAGLNIEPYYEYLNVERSNTRSGSTGTA